MMCGSGAISTVTGMPSQCGSVSRTMLPMSTGVIADCKVYYRPEYEKYNSICVCVCVCVCVCLYVYVLYVYVLVCVCMCVCKYYIVFVSRCMRQ